MQEPTIITDGGIVCTCVCLGCGKLHSPGSQLCDRCRYYTPLLCDREVRGGRKRLRRTVLRLTHDISFRRRHRRWFEGWLRRMGEEYVCHLPLVWIDEVEMRAVQQC